MVQAWNRSRIQRLGGDILAGIALCVREDNNCPMKDECVRYTQESNVMSSFCTFPAIYNEKNNYQYKWEAAEKIKEEQLNEVAK